MSFGIGNSTNQRKAIQKAKRKVASNMAPGGVRPAKIRVETFKTGKRQYRAIARASSRPDSKKLKSGKKGQR